MSEGETPPEGKVTVAIITETGKLDIGISSEFPDGILFYFHEGPHALVFSGAAADLLLNQMLGLCIMSGVVTDPRDLEEAGGTKKKLTLH